MALLTESVVTQFGQNVYMLAQQRGSRLRDLVTLYDMKGEKRTFERVAETEVVESTGRYMDTPLVESKFDRRVLYAIECIIADMIDWQDNLNLLIDPTSPVVRQMMYAMGRKIDDLIIAALTGNAFEGKDGTTPVALPDAQKIAITVGSATSANVGLNIEKLIQLRSLFGEADIDLDDPMNQLNLAVSQKQINDLLRTTEVTNVDYNTVKALYNGTVDTFMGFKFVRLQRLPRVALGGGAYSRTCLAWAKSGVALCLPKEPTTDISQRKDKCNNWQALLTMKCGATRIEDKCVGTVACLE